MKFDELYKKLALAVVNGDREKAVAAAKMDGADAGQLDCLLNPDAHAPVWRLENCTCRPEEAGCTDACFFGAIERDEKGNVTINAAKCVGCEECIRRCKEKKLTESRDILPAMAAVRASDAPVYALIAPAFVSQFSPDVTPGKLRGAFKKLGFAGMVEVAVFADILTLKEALEFDKNVVDNKDFHLTSCCCPIWIAMIRKLYGTLVPHVPGAVSPMIACARTVKKLHPDAKTVFVGPCIAKKSEAKEPDLKGDVDFVLTFAEMRDIFDFANIDPEIMPDDEREHSSRAGRIYARAGGVSEAVCSTVKKLSPSREIDVRPRCAAGVAQCKAMIDDLLSGKCSENFFEGMGCIGGCVGGPKALVDRETGRANVDAYGDSSPYPTPADNPYVIELLSRLGLNTVESLLEDNELFTRKF